MSMVKGRYPPLCEPIRASFINISANWSTAPKCSKYLPLFSNLDKSLSRELITELKEIFTRLNATVVFVSHDINEAFMVADRIYVMHDGQIILEDEPKKILDFKDERVIRLLKS